MSPFLTWNKTRNPDDIISEFPIRFNRYFEPFLGSGEVFFNLYKNGRIFEKGFLASSDKALINTYRAVRDEPERVERMVLSFCEKNTEKFYINLKTAVTCSPSAYIYINRATDKTGKWRAGQFIDRNKEISKDVEDIGRCSRYLNRWCGALWNHDWETTLTPLTGLSSGDVVYLEPPKLIWTADGRIDYVSNGFNESNHVYLNNFCKQLAKKGAKVFMVQDNVPATERIFGKPHCLLGKATQECLYAY